MSSEGRGAALAEHFPDAESQLHAARLGMWLFLATEILLFAGLFVAYALYRSQFPAGFREGSTHLDLALGTINTAVLLTSSLTVAIAVGSVRAGSPRAAALLLLATLALGAAFLAIKGVEYAHKIHEGALPGRFLTADHPVPGMNVFFTVYWISTGLHAAHVTAGMAVLAWMAWRCARRELGPDYFIPIENAGLYWHLVDLVWIFLFPLLYLA